MTKTARDKDIARQLHQRIIGAENPNDPEAALDAAPAAQEVTTQLAPRTHQVGGRHYADAPIQPWDVIDTWPVQQRIGYYRGNALKYLLRLGRKDAANLEARKAEHYCTKLASTLEQDDAHA